MTIRVPEQLIETINLMVRTSRRMQCEIGCEPTLAELAGRLAMPLDKVEKLLAIAPLPTLGSLTPR